MNKLAALTLSAPLLLAVSSNTFACDDKACEMAYLSATTQYIANHGRQAQTAKTEREAHATNRERRDYAVVYHIQRVRYFSSK
jgi:hypothetical protein